MNNDLVIRLSEKIHKSCDIDSNLFKEYKVKRGLRNSDDSGVLVGLSNISNVVGSSGNRNERVAVDGKLIYRGIPVGELSKGFQGEGRYGFEETSYLLLAGQLPGKKELEEFKSYMASLRDLPMTFIKTNMISNRGSDIMNMLARNILFLYTFDKDAEDTSQANLVKQALSLIAKLPVIVAYSYHGMMHAQKRKTLYIRHPKPDLSVAENFLYMLKGRSCYTSLDAEILDLALVLHAEHGGGNNSSFTTRVISSTMTDTYSSMAAAIGSLKGPLHGGANLRVLEMMKNIKKNVKNWQSEGEVMDYLLKILRKEAHNRTGKLYGIGHAVYTLSDPRTVILKEKARELAIEKGKEKEFELYNMIERIAPEAFRIYKKGSTKVLCANVDFYSGFVYESIGIPKEVFTPLFAIARIAGWSAHRLEELNFTAKRIIRPAYRYVAEDQKYLPLSERD